MSGPSGRALGLAGAGVAALVASRGFGTPALAVLGAGMVALPVLVNALVWVVAAGMRVERRVAPARCVAGAPVRLTVAVRGWATRLGLDRLLVMDVDAGLAGVAPDARDAGGTWTFEAVRGDHRLAPARVDISDPFGLARRTRTDGGDDHLIVAPAAPALSGVPLGARARGHGSRRRAADSGFGELDRVRDYQAGDALSRVHWGQTAKRGRLQTKEMRAPGGSGRAVLLLLDGAVPPGEAFETTVTATAALARHLSEGREPVGLVHTGRTPARLPVGRAAWPIAEIVLTRVQAGGDRSLALAVRAEATSPDAPDLIVVLTSGADAGLAAAAAQARRLGVGVAAVLAGPAAAASAELASAGVDVVVVPGPDRVAAAFGDRRERASAS